MSKNKKTYLILILGILILGIFVSSALKKNSQINVNKEPKLIVESEIVDIPIDQKVDPILGNPGAETTIVEFLNFGTCKEKCRLDQQKLMTFVNQNPRKVRLIWKDAPNSNILLSTDNELAHVTAYCVGTKGKFWDFVNLLTNTTEKIDENKLYYSFKALELTDAYMSTCLKSDQATAKVNESFAVARALNLRGSLNLFINNKKIYIDKDRDILEILNRLLEE